jgi:glycosyltransferase involved in cell wall biosynthesis
MKIAIVQGAFYPVPTRRGGAVEKSWYALGIEFAAQGHQVTHYSRRCDDLPEQETIESVRHVRLRSADTPRSMLVLKWRDLLYTLRVATRLTKADVIITHTFWAPIVFPLLRFGPVWVHVQRYPKKQMILYRGAAMIQTVSMAIAQAISRQTPSARPRLRVIANPSLPLKPAQATLKRDPNLMLFVGRVHPEKGIELLVRAAAIARRAAPALRLAIVGPSETKFGGGGREFETHLKEKIAQGDPGITFVGPVFNDAELAEYYERASVFVYPSLAALGEASPVAPLEALAHGCPVVTSDLSCFDDTVGIGSFSHRFKADEPNAAQTLADLLVRITADRGAWEASSRAARARAAEFSIGPIATEYLAQFAALEVAK